MKLFIRDRENIELGKEIGEKIGKEIGKLSVCIRMLKRNDILSDDEMAMTFGYDHIKLQKILDAIQAHPDWDDEQIASELVEAELEEDHMEF